MPDRRGAADESLRLVMGELQVADVRGQVAFSLFSDFESFTVFRPRSEHEKSVNAMLDQVVAWNGGAGAAEIQAAS